MAKTTAIPAPATTTVASVTKPNNNTSNKIGATDTTENNYDNNNIIKIRE